MRQIANVTALPAESGRSSCVVESEDDREIPLVDAPMTRRRRAASFIPDLLDLANACEGEIANDAEQTAVHISDSLDKFESRG